MKLKKVLEKVEYSIINGNTNTEITDICYDSRKIKEGCLFICLVGSSFDGHDYIDSAIEKGAKAILVEKDITREDITIIKVNNTRRVLSQISINYFNNPSSKLTTIAITGTKGKDDYKLNDCKDTHVDISQDDGVKDNVFANKNSTGITVDKADGDKAKIKNKN